jgi:hypothetical protein
MYCSKPDNHISYVLASLNLKDIILYLSKYQHVISNIKVFSCLTEITR